MSHRSALFASIALTLFVALGIFAARDRLFKTGASAGNDVSPTATAVSETTTVETMDGTQPVIEVTLPQPTAAPLIRERDDEEEEDDSGARSFRTSRQDNPGTRSSRASRQDDEDGEGEEYEDD